MHKGGYVYREGSTTLGIVRELKGDRAKVSFIDKPKKSSWIATEDLVQATSLAPVVKDLEFTTKIHPDTKFLYAERDVEFAGDDDPGPIIEESGDVYDLFAEMGWCDTEYLVIGLLDTRRQLVGWKIVHKGAIDNVQASLKELLKDAILGNARCIFMIHCHPSGAADPSPADEDLTAAMQEVLEKYFEEICFFDHLVIGRPGLDPHSRKERAPYFSFREAGMLPDIEEEAD